MGGDHSLIGSPRVLSKEWKALPPRYAHFEGELRPRSQPWMFFGRRLASGIGVPPRNEACRPGDVHEANGANAGGVRIFACGLGIRAERTEGSQDGGKRKLRGEPRETTPNVVNDWRLSEHAGLGIGCDSCHGSEHLTAEDEAKAKLPTAETCGRCHADRLEQFTKASTRWRGRQWKRCRQFTISQCDDGRDEGLRQLPQDWA